MSGSLLRAEVHRFRSRRFIALLLLLGLALFLLVVTIISTQVAKPSEAALQQARGKATELVAEQERFRQECLSHLPPGQPEDSCGFVGPSDLRAEDLLDKQPFRLADDARAGVGGVAGGTAALLFIIGATWIGAEWGSRNIVALLFWEPRRLRVVLTKLGVLVAAAAAVGLVAQALWLLAAKVLTATRGTSAGLADGFWGDLLAMQGRSVLLGVLVACFGFALANLIRNAGAALGIGFVYFAVVENFIRILRPRWQSGLISNNAVALVQPGGSSYFLDDRSPTAMGPKEVVLSNLHGGLVLTVVAVALLALGTVLFVRRDLQ